jgi:hypothetical protein
MSHALGTQPLDHDRPVFRNSSSMAYAIAYCTHTLEMSALRGWVGLSRPRGGNHGRGGGFRAVSGYRRLNTEECDYR